MASSDEHLSQSSVHQTGATFLSDKPVTNLSEAAEALHDAQAKWKFIGLGLGVDKDELDSIDRTYSSNAKKLLLMLKSWLNVGKDTTWNAIVQVLRKIFVGRHDLAYEIEERFLSSTAMTNSKELAAEMKRKEDYKRALEDGSSIVPYIGVMIVGHGGVGKSSLLCGLKKEPLKIPSSTPMAKCESLKSSRDVKGSSRIAEASWASVSNTQWREISEEDEYTEMAQLVQDIYGMSSKSGQHLVEPKKPSEISKRETDRSCSSDDGTVYKKHSVQNIVDKVMQYALKRISKKRTQETWMRVWDCGGQNVFRTILPAFVTSRSMFVLMFDARQYFEKTCISRTNLDGKVIARQDEHLTTQELLLRWMATIHSALCQKSAKPSESLSTKKDMYPKILVVGTHADDSKVKENNEKIIDSVINAAESKPYLSILEDCYIVDNTTAGDEEEEDPKYACIREKIHSMGEDSAIDTPLSWILFRKYLMEYSKSKPVVELAEIQEIASACKIPEESISSVLEFYHSLGVFFHYSHIPLLSQKVIANPHWLIKIIGSLFPFEELLSKVGTRPKWNVLRKYGILVEELLKEVVTYQTRLLKPYEVASLLQHFFIIAEMSTHSKKHSFKGKEYFVPSVLKPNKRDQNCDSSVAPLFLTFSTRYVPPGFFTRFIAVLSQNPMFHISFTDESMSCNQFEFYYGTEHHTNDKISITENIDNVKIGINRLSPSSESSENTCIPNFKQCCKQLIEIFKSSSEKALKWLPSIQMEISLQCHCLRIKDQHFANLSLYQESSSGILCQQSQPFRSTEEQKFWRSVMGLGESSIKTSPTYSICKDSQKCQPHGSISLPQESSSLSSHRTYPLLQEEEVPLSKRACCPSDISCTPQHQSHTTFPQHKEPFDQSSTQQNTSNQIPDLQCGNILRILGSEFSPKAKELGTYLNIPSGKLNEFRHNNVGDVKGMLIDVLDHWLETDPRKSWSKLAEAVEDCGNTVLAEKIRSSVNKH